MSTKKNATDISSILGDITSVRKVNGRIVIKNRPARAILNPTEKQAAVNSKFKEATQWAAQQMQKPDVKALYAAKTTDKLRAPFTVALADYLRPPKVELIDTSGYKGSVGDLIVSKATDDVMVTTVKVSITDATGKLIEQGVAVQDADKAFQWNYAATVANAVPAGTKITVTAYDRPGNQASLDKML